jgi:hypothetical protein
MTDYRIIYPNDDDGIAVVVPAPGVEQTEALRAVPTGKPYLIVDAEDIPTDRTFRDAWQADFTNAQIKE